MKACRGMWTEFFFLVACAAAFFLVVDAAPSCVYLNASSLSSYELNCNGAVDYKYYLPSGYTDAELNTLASSHLSDSRLSILPSKCQVALKKFVCSQVYLKCQPGLSLSDYTTYNYAGYSEFDKYNLPLPMQRPCLSVCSAVDSECWGVLPLLGVYTNCSEARYDYANGAYAGVAPTAYQFDKTNDASVCNVMSASVAVASTREPYLYRDTGGACAGILSDGELWVPPAPSVDSSFAAMQPPYFVQNILEEKLSSVIAKLPVMLSAQCHFALRKYFCGSYMARPEVQVFGDVLSQAIEKGIGSALSYSYQEYLLNGLGVNASQLQPYSFYLPSYPHADVCNEYAQYCGEFAAMSGVAALMPNCSAKLSSGRIQQFPTANQTIDSLSLPLTIGSNTVTLSLDFQTSPNTMSAARDTSGFTTQCPYGFVVPDDPTHPRITWISGTGCSTACRPAIFTREELKQVDGIAIAEPWIGITLLIALMATWLSDKARRTKQYLVLFFAGTSFAATLMFVVASAQRPLENTLCLNNAVTRHQSDGPSVCIAQGVLVMYSGLACCLAWLMQACDLFFKLALNWKSYDHFYYHAFVVFALPLIPVIYTASQGWFGYGQTVPWCFTNDSVALNVDIASFFLWVMIITIIGGVLMVIVIWRIIVTAKVVTGGGGTNSTKSHVTLVTDFLRKAFKKIKILKTSLAFVIMFLVVWICIFAYRGSVYFHGAEATKSFIEWSTCVVENSLYDVADSAWEGVCGKQAKYRIPTSYSLMFFFMASGQGIFVAAIYLSPVIHAVIATNKMIMHTLGLSTDSRSHVRSSGGTNDDSESPSRKKSFTGSLRGVFQPTPRKKLSKVIAVSCMDDIIASGRSSDHGGSTAEGGGGGGGGDSPTTTGTGTGTDINSVVTRREVANALETDDDP